MRKAFGLILIIIALVCAYLIGMEKGAECALRYSVYYTEDDPHKVYTMYGSDVYVNKLHKW